MSSPPLSSIYLAPVPRPTLRQTRTRPSSIISTVSSIPSSVATVPPSSYNRRSKSLELLKSINFLAPAFESEEADERGSDPPAGRPKGTKGQSRGGSLGRLRSLKKSKLSLTSGPLTENWEVVESTPNPADETRGRSHQALGRLLPHRRPLHCLTHLWNCTRLLSPSRYSLVLCRTPLRLPPKMAQDPGAKKKGFFRRLSLSASSHKAQVSTSNGTAHPPRTSGGRSSSGGLRNDGLVVAGPAYDSLPAGAAPNTSKPIRQDGTRDSRLGMRLVLWSWEVRPTDLFKL